VFLVRKKMSKILKLKNLSVSLKKRTEVMRQFSRIESTKPGTIRRLATTVLTKNGPRIGLLKMAIRQKKTWPKSAERESKFDRDGNQFGRVA
jgi:hypothetical protein